MERPLRWGIRCGTAGFGVALLLAALVYTFHALHVDYELDIWCLILWPASLGLMATEKASAVHQVVIVLILSTTNAAMYFVMGFLAGLLPKSEALRSE
jgi:hypothetical protein